MCMIIEKKNTKSQGNYFKVSDSPQAAPHVIHVILQSRASFGFYLGPTTGTKQVGSDRKIGLRPLSWIVKPLATLV